MLLTADEYVRQREKHPAAVASACRWRATYYQFSTKYDSAELFYQKAVEGFMSVQDTGFAILALNERAGNKGVIGKFDEGIALYYEAIDLSRAIKNYPSMMDAKASLSNLYNGKGDTKSAILHLVEAVAYADSVGDLYRLGYYKKTLANTYKIEGNLQEALKLQKSDINTLG